MEKKKITLSVALAVRNEEKNIQACLDSICDIADEIIVVDGKSTDRTVAIAKTFGAEIIAADNPSIFHINKEKALVACKGKWILQLDADEVVTEELAGEIVSVLGLRSSKNNPRSTTYDLRTAINGYYIPRCNIFWGHFMRKGGQYPDYVIRLVRNGKAHFPCKSVHEQIVVVGEIGYLKHPILHYSYRTTEDYWKKADVYTTLSAEELKRKHLPITLRTWFSYSVAKPFFTFFSLFIRHKGFMDGWWGLVFAYWSALHSAISYHKYTKML